jgi:hypothetical protein
MVAMTCEHLGQALLANDFNEVPIFYFDTCFSNKDFFENMGLQHHKKFVWSVTSNGNNITTLVDVHTYMYSVCT